MMKHVALLTFLLLNLLPWVSAAPVCILDIDEIPSKGATQVWSPLFQASWEKLSEMHDSELEKVEPPNPLITKLNEFEWDVEKVMPKNGYAVYAGSATQEFARETAAAIKEQFDIEIEASRIPIIPQGRATYGILLRDLKFKKKFFRSQKKALEFQSRTGETHKVEFFGSTGDYSDGFSDYVKVLHYEAASFILSVETNKEGENLILYCPDRALSFRDAIEHVTKAVKEPLAGSYGSVQDGSLHRKDVVKIPYVTVDADTDFTAQLSGSLHYAGEPLPWRVASAFQMTRFELFEEGARVRIHTGSVDDPFGDPPKPPPVIPRSFVCDRPFYVFLWKTGADWPYLATWIDGADCLTQFAK